MSIPKNYVEGQQLKKYQEKINDNNYWLDH